jgi:hypothetical protein
LRAVLLALADPRATDQLACTCRRLRQAARCDAVWMPLCHFAYPLTCPASWQQLRMAAVANGQVNHVTGIRGSHEEEATSSDLSARSAACMCWKRFVLLAGLRKPVALLSVHPIQHSGAVWMLLLVLQRVSQAELSPPGICCSVGSTGRVALSCVPSTCCRRETQVVFLSYCSTYPSTF